MTAATDGSELINVAIVHYGEGTALDDGYRPGRMGQLASWLHSNGYNVYRVSPSFGHGQRQHRPDGVTPGTSEGTVVVVPTSGYDSSRGMDRLKSLAQFSSRATRVLRSLGPIDVVVVGYPPPGLTLGTRLALGRKVEIVADIRDLWPDAVVSGGPARAVARLAGRTIALELGLANAVVAMSQELLMRAPKRVRKTVIPLGAVWRTKHDNNPTETDPFTAIFIGSFTQLFAFEPMLLGWLKFVESLDPDDVQPRLIMHGKGEQEGLINDVVGDEDSVEQRGWISGDLVPALLENCDAGIAPTREGQGIVISNKVAEYLESGCFLIHSLVPELHGELSDFGIAVSPDNVAEWAAAFATAFSQRSEIRSGRSERREVAESRYGHSTVMDLWTEVIR